MTEQERQIIISKAKEFFRERIAAKHLQNTVKLSDVNEFTINPFIHKYLAQFAFGNSTPESMAKVLLYPRVLGTSISTTFGTQMQYFCSEVLTSYASVVSGIDIEFIDATDNRKKYCQIKAGPNTINKDDVKTIKDHFKGIESLARTNHLDVRMSDCVVGVFYGTAQELSGNYKKINESYPVFVGADFWKRLTGEPTFYNELINAFVEVAGEMNSQELLDRVISQLSESFK